MDGLKRAAAALAAFCAFVCMLLSTALTRVTNASLMLEGFNSCAETAAFSVTPGSYPAYAAMIADYVAGRRDDLTVARADGSVGPAFSERENAHMADVRALVRALGTVRLVTGLLAAAVFLALLLKRGAIDRERRLRDGVRGAAMGAGLFLLALLCLSIWGLIDFDSLFVAFHRLCFRNDLWLLNPRTDLLLAFMPTRFFTWYTRRLLLSALPVLLLAAALIWAAFRVNRPAEKDPRP